MGKLCGFKHSGKHKITNKLDFLMLQNRYFFKHAVKWLSTLD